MPYIGQGYALADSSKVPDGILKIAKIKSDYDQVQNNYTLAKYNYDSAILYAPFAGLIANLNVKEYNQPGAEPFCTLVDNREVEVVFNILKSELPLVKLNDKVIISPFSQGEFKVNGRISELNPIVDKNGMIKVKAVLINQSNKLFEGMNVLVKIQRLLDKRLIIPKSALVLRNNKKVVFTLKNNRANWVYVQTGQENSDSYVVTEGLSPKNSVIYEGNINLVHETPVIVR
jgi:RND family efflux transporter MFP subunit